MVGLARVGTLTQHIAYGPMNKLIAHDFGAPLHTLIVPGNLHPVEEEFLQLFAVS